MIDLRLHAPALAGGLALTLSALLAWGVAPSWRAEADAAMRAQRPGQAAMRRAAAPWPAQAAQGCQVLLRTLLSLASGV